MLGLRGNNFGPKGCLYLQIYAFRSLTHLNMSGNTVGDEGVRNLASASYMRNLKELYLDENGLTDHAAVAIAESPHLNKLVRLSLGYN